MGKSEAKRKARAKEKDAMTRRGEVKGGQRAQEKSNASSEGGITKRDAAVLRAELDRLRGFDGPYARTPYTDFFRRLGELAEKHDPSKRVVQTLRLANGGVIRLVGADQIDVEKYRGLEITFRFIDEIAEFPALPIPQARTPKPKRKGGR